METTLLIPGQYYHIFNHANGGDNLFLDAGNYYYFLGKWQEYTAKILDVLAYCLMPNHFHFLIRVKEDLQGLKDLGGCCSEEEQSKFVHQQLSNFFNSYSKSINARYHRRGSLFNQNFKRKVVTNNLYLRVLVVYIHLNPVSHGFTEVAEEWEHSSIHQYDKYANPWIKRKLVLDTFEDFQDFLDYHREVFLIRNLQGL